MAREAEGRGASVDEATADALMQLGLDPAEDRDAVEIEILQEPRGGLLGIGGHEATVRAILTDGSELDDAEGDVLPVRDRRPSGGSDLEEQADLAADFIEEMLGFMGIDAIAEPSEHRGQMYVDILDGPKEDLQLLVGRRGQTLDAIQELVRTALSRRLDERIRVVIDVEDFRKRHDDRIVEDAISAAEEVRDSGEERELDAMNPYERKLVHDAVAGVEGVGTGSRGVEPDRYVVIFSDDEEPRG